MGSGSDFDHFVMVDWSAARPPNRGPNSIWIAELGPDADAPTLSNPPGQPEAMTALGTIVDAAQRRVLIGFDFCFGVVRGLARRLPGEDVPPWRRLWRHCARHLSDDLSDKWELVAGLNRLAGPGPGPFWGSPDLPRRPERVAGAPAEWRYCEEAARAAGLRPTSVWQAAYAGAVGLQSLTGMARLERLVAGGPAVVWPLQTGLVVPPASARVVLAEVYPAMFPEAGGHRVTDARQVHGTVVALRAAARDGRLARWFVPGVPAEQRAAVVGEEGWTLGISASSATTASETTAARSP